MKDQGIPGVYGLLLLDVVSRWGYHEQNLFAPFGLSTAELASPDMRMSVETANELIKMSLLLTGESSLAFHLGAQMRISIHGTIGYAIMTSHTMGDAIRLASRFISMRLPFMQLYVSELGQNVCLQFQTDIQLQPLRNEIVLAMLIGMHFMIKSLTGIEVGATVDVDFPTPPGFEPFIKHLPNSTFKFAQSHTMISFDRHYLDLKMVNADPISSQIAINQCEAELSALGIQGRRQRVSIKVREILTRHLPQDADHNGLFLGIEAVAERLHMSDRTLKRQLSREGTTFSTIVEEIRYRHATALLSRTDFTLDQIAEQLGYSDLTNFSRAFKRWSGRSPSQWRKEINF